MLGEEIDPTTAHEDEKSSVTVTALQVNVNLGAASNNINEAYYRATEKLLDDLIKGFKNPNDAPKGSKLAKLKAIKSWFGRMNSTDHMYRDNQKLILALIRDLCAIKSIPFVSFYKPADSFTRFNVLLASSGISFLLSKNKDKKFEKEELTNLESGDKAIAAVLNATSGNFDDTEDQSNSKVSGCGIWKI